MTLLALVLVTLGGGLLAWAARSAGRLGSLVAGVALVATALLAALLPDPSPPSLGGEAVLLHGYTRLFLVLGAITAMLLAVVWATVPATAARDALAPRRPDRATDLAIAFLLFLGAAALGLAIVAPGTALLPAAAGGLAGIVAARRETAPSRAVAGDAAPADVSGTSRRLGLDTLRLAIALAAAVVALELLVGPADTIQGVPFGVGAAFLAIALGAGLRLGIVPLHVHAVRLLEARDRSPLPVLSLWGPALFAVVALGAVQAAVLPIELPLSVERGLVAGLAVLSIIAGTAGALVQDDLDHVVAWTVVGDAAFALLGFAAVDAAAWGAARTWLLVFVVAKSALVAWAMATTRTFGTSSLIELRGWARRAPLLAVALALITVATIGLPGLASFDARITLIHGAFTDPARTVALIVSIASVLVEVRIFAFGLQGPTARVQDAPDERLRRLGPDLRRRVGTGARATLDLNRAPASAGGVLVLAVVALAVGAGLFGVRAAASADVPAPLPGPESTGPAGPTFLPVGTPVPSAAPSAAPSAGPSAAPSAAPTRAGATPRPPARTASPKPTK